MSTPHIEPFCHILIIFGLEALKRLLHTYMVLNFFPLVAILEGLCTKKKSKYT